MAVIILNMILHLNEILNTVVSIGVNPFHYVLKLNLQNTGTYFIKRRDHSEIYDNTESSTCTYLFVLI